MPLAYAQAAGAAFSFFSGLKSAGDARRARHAAISAAERGASRAESSLNFFKGQYQDHRRIFGDVEADVYNTTKKLIADGGKTLKRQAFQRINAAGERATANRKARLAQLGISADSGIAVEQELAQFNQLEAAKAQAAFEAPLQALEIGKNFLTLGANRDANLLAGITSGTQTAVNAYGEVASQHSANAQVNEEKAGAAPGIGATLANGGPIATLLSGLGG